LFTATLNVEAGLQTGRTNGPIWRSASTTNSPPAGHRLQATSDRLL